MRAVTPAFLSPPPPKSKMNKETIKTIAIASLILIIASMLIGYSVWYDGYEKGQDKVYNEISRSLYLNGYYNLFIHQNNQTQLIKLIIYNPNEK
ncbi:MAG: hypothetical protein ACTSXY_12305 [Promethearchaeota archaeon]